MSRLDKEEKELLASIERGEWKSTKPSAALLKQYARDARHTLRKNKRINIRIAEADLEGLQEKAVEEGIPYQTLISSVLHKYVLGKIKAA